MKTQASLGWLGPDAEEILVTNRTGSAVAVGDVELLDRIRRDAASTTNAPGFATAGIANIVAPLYDVATHPMTLSCDIAGVVMQAVADDVKCRFRLRGYIDSVQCDTAGSTGTNVTLLTDVGILGDGAEAAVIVSAQTALDGLAQTSIPRKVVFLPLTARAGAGLTDGYFDGINGFGAILSNVDLA